MDNPDKPLISRRRAAFIIVLTIIWFIFFSWVLRGFVPARTEPNITIFAVITSSCLTAVFWLALNMFSAVLVDQRRRRNQGN